MIVLSEHSGTYQGAEAVYELFDRARLKMIENSIQIFRMDICRPANRHFLGHHSSIRQVEEGESSSTNDEEFLLPDTNVWDMFSPYTESSTMNYDFDWNVRVCPKSGELA